VTGPDDPDVLADVPRPLRRRTNAIAIVAMTAIAAALMVLVLLVQGVRPSVTTWAVLAAVAAVVIAGIVVALRSLTQADRAVLADAERRVLDPIPDPGVVDLDLTAAEHEHRRDGIDEDAIVLEADAASGIDLTHEPVVRVVLHPGPIMRRRLAERPDALVVVADRDALDVPGWIVEGRSRVIERTDRVVVPWPSNGSGCGPSATALTSMTSPPHPARRRAAGASGGTRSTTRSRCSTTSAAWAGSPSSSRTPSARDRSGSIPSAPARRP
jgi:hypothetical protein